MIKFLYENSKYINEKSQMNITVSFLSI